MVARDPARTLVPGHAARGRPPSIVGELFPDGSVVADVVHTSVGEDAHRVDALLDLGRAERLDEVADTLRAHGAAVAMWACTSGSFVFGCDGARRQAEQLAAHFGGPASSTSPSRRRATTRTPRPCSCPTPRCTPCAGPRSCAPPPASPCSPPTR
jgi:hypothetical protein